MRTTFGPEGEIRGTDILAALVALWREGASGTLQFSRSGATSGFELAAGEIVGRLVLGSAVRHGLDPGARGQARRVHARAARGRGGSRPRARARSRPGVLTQARMALGREDPRRRGALGPAHLDRRRLQPRSARGAARSGGVPPARSRVSSSSSSCAPATAAWCCITWAAPTSRSSGTRISTPEFATFGLTDGRRVGGPPDRRRVDRGRDLRGGAGRTRSPSRSSSRRS